MGMSEVGGCGVGSLLPWKGRIGRWAGRGRICWGFVWVGGADKRGRGELWG